MTAPVQLASNPPRSSFLKVASCFFSQINHRFLDITITVYWTRTYNTIFFQGTIPACQRIGSCRGIEETFVRHSPQWWRRKNCSQRQSSFAKKIRGTPTNHKRAKRHDIINVIYTKCQVVWQFWVCGRDTDQGSLKHLHATNAQAWHVWQVVLPALPHCQRRSLLGRIVVFGTGLSSPKTKQVHFESTKNVFNIDVESKGLIANPEVRCHIVVTVVLLNAGFCPFSRQWKL